MQVFKDTLIQVAASGARLLSTGSAWFSERVKVKRKPDLMLVLMAVFGVGVLLTLLLPMAANDTVAAPASELQAGVILQQ